MKDQADILKENADLTAKVATLEAAAKTATDNSAALLKRAEDTEGKLTKATTDLTAAQSKVTQLEADLKTATTKAADLEAKEQDLEKRVANRLAVVGIRMGATAEAQSNEKPRRKTPDEEVAEFLAKHPKPPKC